MAKPHDPKENLPQPSPDTRGLDIAQSENVDDQAAVANRDVRQLAKKSHQQQTRNTPQKRREKDL